MQTLPSSPTRNSPNDPVTRFLQDPSSVTSWETFLLLAAAITWKNDGRDPLIWAERIQAYTMLLQANIDKLLAQAESV